MNPCVFKTNRRNIVGMFLFLKIKSRSIYINAAGEEQKLFLVWIEKSKHANVFFDLFYEMHLLPDIASNGARSIIFFFYNAGLYVAIFRVHVETSHFMSFIHIRI